MSTPNDGATQIPAPKPVAPAVTPDAAKAMTLFVMIVVTLYFGKEVLVPIVLALLLAFILAPLVDLLRRIHLGRVPSVLLGVLVAIGIILGIGGVIGTQISELTGDFPKYLPVLQQKFASVKQATIGRITILMDRAERSAPAASTAPATAGHPGQPAAATPAPAAAAPAAAAPAASPVEIAEKYISTILSPVETLFIVIIIAVFALLQREDLRDRLIRLIGSTDLHRTTLAIDEGGRRLSTYYLAQLSINTVFGVVIGIGLFFVGVPNPVLWGIVSALLRFVPYVGAGIAALLPITLAAAVEPGWTMALWTAALYLVVEGVTGQVVEPLVYGHNTGLSPFSVVVAAIFWSWLWGPIGLIMSTPLTLCLVVMGRHVKRLEFLDVMLGDRPALTPVESFYQRILAGDADEAEDHAEQILKDRPLSTYYDEVALKGLQLAANDAKRGVVHGAQLEQIRETVMTVINGLANHGDEQPKPLKTDVDPVAPPAQERVLSDTPVPASLEHETLVPPWSHDGAVLCVAGRGLLDEAASAMLVQLLGKHGMGARLVPHDAVSRENIAALDVGQVAMVCVSYLDLAGSPAHLRYLVRRLRQKLPQGTPILVGLWPAEDSALSDAQIQHQIGADNFVSSLHEAVTACVEAAKEHEGVRIAAE